MDLQLTSISSSSSHINAGPGSCPLTLMTSRDCPFGAATPHVNTTSSLMSLLKVIWHTTAKISSIRTNMASMASSLSPHLLAYKCIEFTCLKEVYLKEGLRDKKEKMHSQLVLPGCLVKLSWLLEHWREKTRKPRQLSRSAIGQATGPRAKLSCNHISSMQLTLAKFFHNTISQDSFTSATWRLWLEKSFTYRRAWYWHRKSGEPSFKPQQSPQ